MNRIEFGRTAPAVDVMSCLRAATRAQHAVLDANLPLAAKDAGAAQYRQHLDYLHRWLQQIGAGIAAYRDGPYPFAAEANRAGIALLRRDLGLDAGALAPVPEAASIMADPSFRWGAQYVIEGSGMGASMLYRRLGRELPDCSMLFFAAAHGRGKARWLQFCAAVACEVDNPHKIQSAERGAVHAFDCFSRIAMPGR